MSEVALIVELGSNDDGATVEVRETARDLARELNLPLFILGETVDDAYEFRLKVSETGLELISVNIGCPGTLKVDFEHPTLSYRVRNQVKLQMIVRAVGKTGGVLPSVLDATAGLGKDAFLLASAGYEITMLEQNAVVHALLRDGMSRARVSEYKNIRFAIEAMKLLNTSLADFASTRPKFDVVYLDPMFPTRRKSARVKKEMFFLQKYLATVENENDNAKMMIDAFAIATRRVVVKRPLRAPNIDYRIPTFKLTGRSSRFDVYAIS